MNFCAEYCKQTVELENVEIHINSILFWFFLSSYTRIKLNYLPVVVAFPLHIRIARRYLALCPPEHFVYMFFVFGKTT